MNRKKISSITFILEFIFKVLITFLGIFKTRLIIQYLGDSTNGLYQLIIQLLAFVTIADLGLDSIYRFSYYKPLHNKNNIEINKIYNGSRKFFKLSSISMLFLAIIISLLLPSIANNDSFSTNQLIFIMMIFALPPIIETFIMPDISLVSAQQKTVYVHTFNNISFIIRLIISIITISTKNFFIFIIIDSIITISFHILKYISLKKYNNSYKNLTDEVNNKPLKLAKYTIFNSFNFIVYNNIDNIILTHFFGPVYVSIYSSYYFVIKALSDIITNSIASIVDSVGDLFAANEKAFNVMSIIQDLLFYIAMTLSIPLCLGIRDFIKLTITNNPIYYLSNDISLLFVLLFIIVISTSIWDLIIKANGLYKQTWKISLIELLLNIILSIILSKHIGLTGVIFGTVFAKIVKTIYYTYTISILYKSNIKNNLYRLCKRALTIVITFFGLYKLMNYIMINSLFSWVIYMCLSTFFSATIFFVIFYIFYPNFKNFIQENIFRRFNLCLKK